MDTREPALKRLAQKYLNEVCPGARVDDLSAAQLGLMLPSGAFWDWAERQPDRGLLEEALCEMDGDSNGYLAGVLRRFSEEGEGRARVVTSSNGGLTTVEQDLPDWLRQ
jgi:hypothetical protein